MSSITVQRRSLMFLLHRRPHYKHAHCESSPSWVPDSSSSSSSSSSSVRSTAYPWRGWIPHDAFDSRKRSNFLNDFLRASRVKEHYLARIRANSLHLSLIESLREMSKSYDKPRNEIRSEAGYTSYNTHQEIATLKRVPKTETAPTHPPNESHSVSNSLLHPSSFDSDIPPEFGASPSCEPAGQIVKIADKLKSSPKPISEVAQITTVDTKLSTKTQPSFLSQSQNEKVQKIDSAESITDIRVSDMEKLSPADLIASLRYYDRKRGSLPDEEPLSAADVAFLESRAREKPSDSHFAWKKAGIALSSVIAGAYIIGVGNKLLFVPPETTAASEMLSAVRRSRANKTEIIY
ncbi:hypothetical protein ABW20_dc0101946 [Dactylellina cionopaga]|nr:hypothetical protein ABW20_dc0101946 [Dactylellina cionopaga]